MPFSTIFQLYRGVSIIGGGNRSTQRKQQSCCKSLTNYHIMIYRVHRAMNGVQTHNYHTIMTMSQYQSFTICQFINMIWGCMIVCFFFLQNCFDGKDNFDFLFQVAKLQRASLQDPVKVEVSSKYQTVEKLQQSYLFIPLKHKVSTCIKCQSIFINIFILWIIYNFQIQRYTQLPQKVRQNIPHISTLVTMMWKSGHPLTK